VLKSQKDRLMEGERVCVRDLDNAIADAFAITKQAYHSSVIVSQRQIFYETKV
jgi:hypothetical protein